jgi:hypothetical protein
VNSEEKKNHDFSNFLLEFRYSVERADQMMIEYCDGELERNRERGVGNPPAVTNLGRSRKT